MSRHETTAVLRDASRIFRTSLEHRDDGHVGACGRQPFDHLDPPLVGEHSEDLQSKPLNDALDQLSTAADKVQKCIKEQTRFVVSATVISNANDIIHLSQHIRRLAKAN